MTGPEAKRKLEALLPKRLFKVSFGPYKGGYQIEVAATDSKWFGVIHSMALSESEASFDLEEIEDLAANMLEGGG